MYMLDTNTCIYIIKRRPVDVLKRFEAVDNDQICISVVTHAELQYGVVRSSKIEHNQRILDAFVARLTVWAWGQDAVAHYGRIRRHLEQKGTPIGNMDLLIAAHALAKSCTLVTNNQREFERVPELETANWI
ncbi:MAG: type II toxin-antitoxin system VapC family toxin [Gemmatimonadetes bacterium]|jgi:tRNA(fMet)-specific endonuclease VapC|nr:type II toxin-antitoxin system VapC family toxin [Gemmatimonadota bacterium]MBT7915652.1 type II toxin-antitoxin system VapC family toxin [Candidatus Bathyarchaeota archaeon]